MDIAVFDMGRAGSGRKAYDSLEGVASGFDISLLSEAELLRLRGEIDARLPLMSLQGLNLEEELVKQYRAALAMQSAVLSDEGVPANQRAQVVGAVASIIAQLTKTQVDFYSAERMKSLEGALIDVLRTWPEDQTAEFFEQYEKMLNK